MSPAGSSWPAQQSFHKPGRGGGFSEKPEAEEEFLCLWGTVWWEHTVVLPPTSACTKRRQEVEVFKRRNVPIMQIQTRGAETKAGKRATEEMPCQVPCQGVTIKTPPARLPRSGRPSLQLLDPTTSPPNCLESPCSLVSLSSVPWPQAIGHRESKTILACSPSNFWLPAPDPGTGRSSVNICCLNKRWQAVSPAYLNRGFISLGLATGEHLKLQPGFGLSITPLGTPCSRLNCGPGASTSFGGPRR